MARAALLVGTGEYGAGFKKLPAAPKDVAALEQVLRDPDMGGFDEVTTLINPQHFELAEAIETWFRERQKDDIALLYLSGHGVKDSQRELYFAANNTRKDKAELVTATAVSARFVHDRIRQSKCKRQVIILDCCFSGAFGDLLARDDDAVDLDILGAEGRVVLTSSSSIQYSFEQREGGLSIYTRYLLEGIQTGAADIDGDGAISVDELHQYASRKVQEESPAMTPKLIVLKDEGFRIRIAKAPLGDPRVKYRKEVEAIVQEDEGEIDPIFSRPILEEWQQQLQLPVEEAEAIEAAVLEPFRQRNAKLERYRQVFTQAIQHKYPLGERERKRLKQLQQVLGLREEDAAEIETAIELPPTPPPTVGAGLARSSDANQNVSSKPAPTQSTFSKLRSLLQTSDDDDLTSERFGADYYTKLRDLLKAGNWQEADKETADRMCEVMDRQEEGGLRVEDIQNFPCQDLQNIDRLWVKHSGGKFGFSVQKNIYQECGGKLDGSYLDNGVWEKFGDCVGWRNQGSWLSGEAISFKDSAPLGELPAWAWWGAGGWGTWLFYRVATCDPTSSDADNLPQPNDPDDLSSERFGDNYYARLRDFLKAGKWKEADEETADRMCEVMDRQKERWLRVEDIQKFPCQDLRNINQLWVKYSNGKFGFSVQKKIWQECGSPTNYSDDETKFGDRIGWRVKGDWISYDEVTFDISALEGHLPSALIFRAWARRAFLFSCTAISFLANRFTECSTK